MLTANRPGICTRWSEPPATVSGDPVPACRSATSLIKWTDPAGTDRYACVWKPSVEAPGEKFPLIVFLHGAPADADQATVTGLSSLVSTAIRPIPPINRPPASAFHIADPTSTMLIIWPDTKITTDAQPVDAIDALISRRASAAIAATANARTAWSAALTFAKVRITVSEKE